ncbi:hypothetical protein Ccrd_025013 [Cynara cardunculus var. scolymus]|uniref:Uncharacterized protein n=1 Tax=Cynara cardunculus var. scolymus TaxID=59895 RepID=A0A118JRZ2_CYNCS|nr:hypothetical protein Ccrd_025013 [Cynara cardunculus var. scolymus]
MAAITLFSPPIFTLNFEPATPHSLVSTTMNKGNGRKRPAQQPPVPPQPPKHQATEVAIEEEDMDEDVFLEENLVDEDELILRDMEDREALATRLEKWKRPVLSTGYQSQSEKIGNFTTVAVASHKFLGFCDSLGFKQIV